MTTASNLTIDNALHGVRELLAERISPEIGGPFAVQMARLSCILLTICANGVDDAAELRVEENAAIRAMLGKVAAVVSGPLADRLADVAGSADPGLKLSVLDRENHRLRCLLVEAHAALEDNGAEAAQALDRQIWQLLEEIENKRAPRE